MTGGGWRNLNEVHPNSLLISPKQTNHRANRYKRYLLRVRTAVINVEKMCANVQKKSMRINLHRIYKELVLAERAELSVLHLWSISTIVILHHSEEECAHTRPGAVAVLLCQLLVLMFAGSDSPGRQPWRGRRGGLPLRMLESEMSVSGSSSAHTRLDQRAAVLTQTLLLLQRPGYLLPVKLDVRRVLTTNGRPGDVLTADSPALLPAGDSEGEEVVTCCYPGAL